MELGLPSQMPMGVPIPNAPMFGGPPPFRPYGPPGMGGPPPPWGGPPRGKSARLGCPWPCCRRSSPSVPDPLARPIAARLQDRTARRLTEGRWGLRADPWAPREEARRHRAVQGGRPRTACPRRADLRRAWVDLRRAWADLRRAWADLRQVVPMAAHPLTTPSGHPPVEAQAGLDRPLEDPMEALLLAGIWAPREETSRSRVPRLRGCSPRKSRLSC